MELVSVVYLVRMDGLTPCPTPPAPLPHVTGAPARPASRQQASQVGLEASHLRSPAPIAWRIAPRTYARSASQARSLDSERFAPGSWRPDRRAGWVSRLGLANSYPMTLPFGIQGVGRAKTRHPGRQAPGGGASRSRDPSRNALSTARYTARLLRALVAAMRGARSCNTSLKCTLRWGAVLRAARL